MALTKGGMQAYSSAFSWEQCFTARGEYPLSRLTPSPVGGERGGKVGAVTHMLWWRVWKFREISDCPRVTTKMNDGSRTGMGWFPEDKDTCTAEACPGHRDPALDP